MPRWAPRVRSAWRQDRSWGGGGAQGGRQLKGVPCAVFLRIPLAVAFGCLVSKISRTDGLAGLWMITRVYPTTVIPVGISPLWDEQVFFCCITEVDSISTTADHSVLWANGRFK